MNVGCTKDEGICMNNSKKYLAKQHGLKKYDRRLVIFQKEIREKGFCSADLWCLYHTIASFILPRLKEFSELGNSISTDIKKSDRLLKSMIWSFEYALAEDNHLTKTGRVKSDKVVEKEYERFLKGMKNFSENFFDLWT